MTEFERLFLDHREFVFRYLLKLSGDSSLAEELTQEAFFRAYMNLPRLRDREKAPAWLCSIARNAYFSWYNGQKKLSPLEEVPAETGTPEETLLAAEDARRLLAWPCRAGRALSDGLSVVGPVGPLSEGNQPPLRQERELGPGHLLPRETKTAGKDGVTPWTVP